MKAWRMGLLHKCPKGLVCQSNLLERPLRISYPTLKARTPYLLLNSTQSTKKPDLHRLHHHTPMVKSCSIAGASVAANLMKTTRY